ncbi:MAG: restriction endonuclease subunit S [Actinobacteria bacterium]|nr:MAG: restriction endonuclease subunit S [Actinomycetota bacterium]
MYQGEFPEPCAIQNQLIRFRARSGVSPEFASHLFRYCQESGVFSRIALQTTSVAHLGVSRLQKLTLAWPVSEAEQRAIAAALSDVDALISSLDRLISKKRAVKTAAMQQLLTGKWRLPGFSGKWQTKRLGDLGTTYGGITGKTRADFHHGEGQFITFLNVMNNVTIDVDSLGSVNIDPSENQNEVAKGDLFFNGSSETPEELGMCSVLLEDVKNVYLNSFCFGFRPHSNETSDAPYLAYYFRSGEGRKLLHSLAQGATRYNLSKINLLKLEMPLPSHEEQTAIANVLSDMDAEISALEYRRKKTRLVKRGMMQELLTGRTRLVSEGA